MDKHLDKKEEQLLQLIESKNLNELSSSERNFVEGIISFKEYESRRLVVTELSNNFEQNIIPLPLSLPLKPDKTNGILLKPIPLYQVFISIAAIVLLMFMLVPFSSTQIDGNPEVEFIVQHDTIEIENLVHDTVFEIKEKLVYVEKVVYVQNEGPICQREEPRLLDSNPGISLPNLNLVEIENSGTSLRDDVTAILITDYFGLNP